MGLTQPKRCVLYQDLISTYQRSSVPILVLSCRNEHSGLFLWLRQQTIELTLHYLKLSRLKITNFHLFMPTHHNILIIRLTKRTTLHCSSPATTHPTCTMLVHKAHACAETRCTPPSLSLSLSLPGYIYLLQTTTYQPIRWPNGFVEGQPIGLQSWIRQLTSYSQPHRGSYRVRHYSNTT